MCCFCIKKQLVNCCATYQAVLQRKQQEKGRILSNAEEEEQLYIDVGRLSSAVQAVNSMLNEIESLLKVLL